MHQARSRREFFYAGPLDMHIVMHIPKLSCAPENELSLLVPGSPQTLTIYLDDTLLLSLINPSSLCTSVIFRAIKHPHLPPSRPSNMARDPRETWAQLQRGFQNAQEQGRRGLGGSPKGVFGGAAGLILLAGGVIVANNALFNGRSLLPPVSTVRVYD